MKSQLIIDIATIDRDEDPYREQWDAGSVTLGGSTINVLLTNVPRDRQKELDKWQERFNQKSEEAVAQMQLVREQKVKVQELQRKLDMVEDAPRPPVSEQVLQEVLRTIPEVQQIDRVKVVRLVTGWGITQANAFVTANQPGA